MLKRAGLWISAIFVIQLALLAYFLLFGSFAYMGTSDTRSMQVAMQLFEVDLSLLIRRMWALDALVLLGWTLPLGVAFVAWRPRWRQPGWWLFGPLVGLAYAGWLGLAALRSPSLLSGSLYGDGSTLTGGLMAHLCTRWGPAWLSLLGAVLALGLGRLVGRRLAVATVAWYALVVGLLWSAEAYAPRTRLPEGSVVLLVTDSLRADHFTAEATPALYAATQAAGATTIPQVIPPLARTTPAVVSLLTGKLPVETGVTTMFSNRETFNQSASVVSAYRAAGYCTVAVGEYPAEMLTRYELGFEVVDVPRARFKEIALQAVLANDPFILSVESWSLLRGALGKTMAGLVRGLPLMAAPRELVHRLDDAVAGCGGRPVFAFVFADQPHYPYAQLWPYYLERGADYAGRFKFCKDDTSAGALSPTEKQHIRDLYATSLRSSDAAFGALVAHLGGTGQLAHSTVVVTGDHGESLYDGLDIVGHGDQVGELEGIAVPWVVVGHGREVFAGLGAAVQSTRLAERLAALHGVAYPKPSDALPPDALYVETDMWLANTPNLPAARVRYPELSGLLTVKDGNSDIELDRAFLPTVEFSKHRLWVLDGHRYTLAPTARDVLATRDGVPVSPAELPAPVRAFLHRFYPDFDRALVP